MQFEQLNFDEFEESLKSLKRNKAAGFDDLSSNTIIDALWYFKKYPIWCFQGLNKNIEFHSFNILETQRNLWQRNLAQWGYHRT